MARGRPLPPLTISPDTREELALMARSRSLPAGLVCHVLDRHQLPLASAQDRHRVQQCLGWCPEASDPLQTCQHNTFHEVPLTEQKEDQGRNRDRGRRSHQQFPIG